MQRTNAGFYSQLLQLRQVMQQDAAVLAELTKRYCGNTLRETIALVYNKKYY